MEETKKQRAKLRSDFKEIEKSVRKNHLDKTIRKNNSVEDENCFIVPWQLQ